MIQELDKEKLRELGLERLDEKDRKKLEKQGTTDLVDFEIPFSAEKEAFLKKENIEYERAADGNGEKLKFKGRVKTEKECTAENTPENIDILKNANIQFDELPERKILKLRDTAILGAAVVHPAIGAILAVRYACKIIPKRINVKNDMGLADGELKSLKAGKTIQHRDNGGNVFVMQLDRKTNGVVSINQKDIRVPDSILGYRLSHMEKARLKGGAKVSLPNGVELCLDLNNPNGVKYTAMENNREISYEEAARQQAEGKQQGMKI